jgi:hypothetical protein
LFLGNICFYLCFFKKNNLFRNEILVYDGKVLSYHEGAEKTFRTSYSIICLASYRAVQWNKVPAIGVWYKTYPFNADLYKDKTIGFYWIPGFKQWNNNRMQEGLDNSLNF